MLFLLSTFLVFRPSLRSFVRAQSSEKDSQKILRPANLLLVFFFLRGRRTRSIVAKRSVNGPKRSENDLKWCAAARRSARLGRAACAKRLASPPPHRRWRPRVLNSKSKSWPNIFKPKLLSFKSLGLDLRITPSLSLPLATRIPPGRPKKRVTSDVGPSKLDF